MIPFSQGLEISPDDAKKELELEQKIRRGLMAEESMARFGWVFDNIENAVIDKFKSLDPGNYQKFDNSQYFVLSLKLKVIREIREMLGIAVTDGSIAREDLQKLQGGQNANR